MGPDAAAWALYFQIAWIYPVMVTWAGTGSAMLIARTSALWEQSRLAVVMAAVFFVIGILFVGSVGGPSFVVAWSVATAVNAVLMMRLVGRVFDLTFVQVAEPLVRLLAVLVIPGAVAILLRLLWPIGGLPVLFAQLVLCGCDLRSVHLVLWAARCRPQVSPQRNCGCGATHHSGPARRVPI